MQIDYSEILDTYEDLIKNYTIALFYADIRKDEDGTWFINLSDWEKEVTILAGWMPDDMVADAFKDWEIEQVDREGEWEIKALLKFNRGDEYERGYAEIMLTEIRFVQTLKEREEFEKLINEKNIWGA